MGGSAFKEDGLWTPRMPTVVYNHVLQQTQTLLKPHFKHVGTAIEGPSKTTHGDVDILVADPVDKSHRKSGDFLASVVGAKQWKTTGASLLHFAVPWPQEFENDIYPSEVATAEDSGESDEGKRTRSGPNAEEVDQTPDIPRPENPRQENPRLNIPRPDTKASKPSVSSKPLDVVTSQKYIQVDIQICPTATAWEWQLFYQAHGDLWSMLGIIIRRFGLTCSYNGLELRIKEVESHNKLHSRVKMTQIPSQVLEYLGLDVGRYWTPFKSWDDMMAYVGNCRFHDPGRWKNEPKKEEEDEAQVEKPPAKKATVDTTTENKELMTLKHNDRARAEKRPVLRYWFDTYLPRHVDDQPGKDAQLSREDVIQDAKEFFGGEFASRFDEKKTKWVRIIAVDQLWSDIRKILPGRDGTMDGIQIGYVMRGVKRELAGERDEYDAGDEAPEGVRLAFQEGRFEVVFAWAKENWKKVAEREEVYLTYAEVDLKLRNRRQKQKGAQRNAQKSEGAESAAIIDHPPGS
ncbi:hypothetical protein LTR10_022021 [Elasticomyces elasticus]|uniref:Polymerase nucleotidyl transferase domain-containing protein n=1 Tax=Exophiala sideris TaxID=1016849 RepID=A0ABR0IYY3_9EURO|nr:hypothetical protein LTR10_022021 [Elasticomyces elasticus]KAK5022899.1 hypothetical protein LTS07_009627 [Exophiala sideris]KAK5026423.1 hypothetical protein LTR13_010037 [Exophiala sideris]KAK5052358.1 hypothetical protein LTR69_009894 [Exophiala sideris]KAK5177385.1 hypothetical protein LTR44_010180 [Eurotiomycetes sp. CCFEE 6388]